MIKRASDSEARGSVLFLGDLHLGRRPARLPADLGIDAAALGPSAALARAVEFAVDEGVAAVVCAGDVVESLEDRFEAGRPVGAAIEALGAAGIAMLAVAGNHDVRALPRLAALHDGATGPGLRLLGREGGFESVVLRAGGEPFCRLHGWSFRHEREHANPLTQLAVESLDGDLPNLGVLHCDVDATESPYAPVARRDFEAGAAGRLAAWFLGHVHRPDFDGLSGKRPVGYLGSVAGLDFGEPGPHGPWLAEVLQDGTVRAEQVPLAPIRYLHREAQLQNGDVGDALSAALLGGYRTAFAELGADRALVRAVGVRLRVQDCVSARAVRRAAEVVLPFVRELGSGRERVVFFCDRVEPVAAPAYDLTELVTEATAEGTLARFLAELDANPQPMVAALCAQMAERSRGRGWSAAGELSTAQAGQLLREGALELIADFVEQRGRDDEVGA